MQFKVLITFLVVFTFSFPCSISLDITDCGSYFGFDEIDLEGCTEDYEACPLYRNQIMNISFTIDTKAFNIDSEIVNDVKLIIRGGPQFVVNVTPIDPCDVLKCPLETNYKAKYSAKINVTFPPLSNVDLKWILKTADYEEQLLCFQFPVTVQDIS